MTGTNIETWSTTAANNDATGGLWQEGQTRSSVNNSARAMQATLRTWYNDPIWVQVGDLDEEATIAHVTGTQFSVAGADVTDTYTAGRRVRAVGSSTGDILGTIIGSSFSTDTTVTVDWDGGDTIANEALTIYLSAITQEDNQLPRVCLQKPNLIPNGEFLIWQNGTSFTATGSANDDDSYTADQCILLSDGNDIVDLTRNTTLTTRGYGYAICQLDIETANKKAGLLFPVETLESAQLAGKRCSLSFKARDDSGNTTLETIRAAVIEWTSTADSITSDVVSAWNAAGANPTLVANWAYASTPFSITLSTTLREFRINNIGVSSSATNVAVFIWVDDTDATVGDIIYIGDVNLVEGEVATPIMRRPFNEALQLCQRFFVKTFPHGTAPAQNAGQDGALFLRAADDGDVTIPWRYGVEMISQPTVTTYNPLAANSDGRNLNDASDVSVNTVVRSENSLRITLNGAAGDAGDLMAIHVTADARL